jgi:response regulator RpfG family c-di-GMP phosphodiesterase
VLSLRTTPGPKDSIRPFRAALTIDEAFAVLEAGSGTHFDPDLVAAFIQLMRTKRPLGRLSPVSGEGEP